MFDCPIKSGALDAPKHLAIVSEKETITYLELDEKITFLAKSLPIRPGELAALLVKPSIQTIALFFAIWRKGASLCPLNLRDPPQKIEHSLQRLSPELYINDDQILPKGGTFFSSLPLLLLFTSGSTGTPKLAALSLNALLENAKSAFPKLLFERTDRYLLSLPLFHVSGIAILFRTFLGKGTLSLSWEDPKISHLSIVPSQLRRPLEAYKHLKCLLVGGGPLPSLPSYLPCFTSYGLTEMGSLVALNGKVLDSRELKLKKDGEIFVRGKTLFEGYVEQGSLTLPLQDGWFNTKDLGALSEKGKLTILGRKDRMFISGGENIHPEEIERELLSHPSIEKVLVYPIENAEFGKRPAATIQTQDPHLNLKTLQTFLQDRLPKYKIPIQCSFSETLPKNSDLTGIKS